MSNKNKTIEEVGTAAYRSSRRMSKREAIANRPTPTMVRERHLKGIARVLRTRNTR